MTTLDLRPLRLACRGVLAGLLLFTAWPVAAADPIRIGDINSYTRLPAHTEPYRNGALLALEAINEAGGVAGRPLEMISRDDRGEPGEAVKLAEELVGREDVALLTGSFFSHVGLALSAYAKQRQVLYLAAEPLADALVWENGNRYTFRLRPSTYMQAAMLAEQAAKTDAVRWATIAPNYAYGQDAVAAFKMLLKAAKPEVEFVTEQWPALFKIDAGAEVQALAAAEPDGIYNVTFGVDLAKFVREGEDRGLFNDRVMVGLLTGEPEYLEPLGDEAPEGWIVTGYPWSEIDTPAHNDFVEAYVDRFGETPKLGSIVGYNTILAIASMLEATGGDTDTEKMVEAMKGLSFESPFGPVVFRAADHQATMGTFVGITAPGEERPTMRDWFYADGADYLPDEATVSGWRPAD